MKRIVSIILALSLLLGCAGLTCFAQGEVQTPYEDSLFYTSGDYTLHYRVIEHKGEYRGRILMLHGFVCSTYAWRNMAAGMANAGYDCVLLDLPNFGYSTRESKGIDYVDREELVARFMESIAPTEEWIVAGHSMGGGVAINIAEENKIKALLLYCPAPQSNVPESLSGVVTSLPVRAAMNTFLLLGLKITPLVRLAIYAATVDWDFAMDYDTKGVTAPLQYGNAGAAMCYMICNVRKTDLKNTDKITCPVLICQAEKDLVLSASMKKDIAAAFPDAQYYEVKGGGHQCIENRADELCRVALEFLR